jgi:hypothetical protein
MLFMTQKYEVLINKIAKDKAVLVQFIIIHDFVD